LTTGAEAPPDQDRFMAGSEASAAKADWQVREPLPPPCITPEAGERERDGEREEEQTEEAQISRDEGVSDSLEDAEVSEGDAARESKAHIEARATQTLIGFTLRGGLHGAKPP
jgi:hypothetical protein